MLDIGISSQIVIKCLFFLEINDSKTLTNIFYALLENFWEQDLVITKCSEYRLTLSKHTIIASGSDLPVQVPVNFCFLFFLFPSPSQWGLFVFPSLTLITLSDALQALILYSVSQIVI